MLAEIFRSSIEQLTGEDYSEAQQQAWASAADDEQAFGARLAGELTLIATLDGSPVGFASLKGPDQIEMLYVHPAMARQGVGSMLVDALEKIATARGTNRLIVDASDTANGFFDKRGYVAQQRNTVTCGDEWLANTTMEKRLTEKPSAS
jgi:putative acetyltransferase